MNEWLISKDAVSFDAGDLEGMLSEVKQVRGALLDLVVQGDYEGEQRGYLVNVIRNLLSLEDSIVEMEHQNYLSRSELDKRFDQLHRAFIHNFDWFVTFYERTTGDGFE
ncbi:hypothetical protein [Gracilibacillus salinarum]|uniref:Uncharacterized protein n=1 Tax=Gracilibacillus salinarum TaxID=2932255 RepID=A0ABY4GR82_9BACI|nr:hypothetical protein [Gracilibacillus salinarum]UOQ86908.1 hypothetical protein MUN87_08500 [Gracilibacillus salinarum]